MCFSGGDTAMAALLRAAASGTLSVGVVGRGRYGEVFAASGTGWRDVLRAAAANTLPFGACATRAYCAAPVDIECAGETVAFKVQMLASDDWERDAILEERCLQRLGDAATMRDEPPVAPRLYGGFSLAGVGGCQRVRVTIMELVRGPTLYDFLASKRMSRADARQLGQRIRSAVRTMWSMGVAHCDLHGKNVVVVAGAGGGGSGSCGQEVRFVDFGMGVLLPPRRRQRLAYECECGTDPAVAFACVCARFARSEVAARGVEPDDANLDDAFLLSFLS